MIKESKSGNKCRLTGKGKKIVFTWQSEGALEMGIDFLSRSGDANVSIVAFGPRPTTQ